MNVTAGATKEASPLKPPSAAKRRLRPPRLNETWRRRLPLLPALLFLIVLTQVPFVMSIFYSLTDWKVVPPGPREFVGLDNYSHLLDDTFFRDAAWTSVELTVIPVIGSLALGSAFALLLDRKFLGQGLVRTLLITPFLLMPVVVGLVWKNQMFHGLYGVINWGIETLGGTPVEFVSRYPTWAIVIVLIWQWTPFMMLIMLAGLQSQPSDVLEAAKVDGATPWGIFRQLTVGHLRPYMELGILLGTIYLIQVYDQVAVMTGGGPGSTNLPYFVFERSIGGGWEFGQASSYSIVVVIFSIAIATVALRVLSGLLKGEEIA
jgi:sorbitol/mannitol transport system permease protein